MGNPRYSDDGPHLPGHLLSLIFCKLTASCGAEQAVQILLANVSLVCKSWRFLLISKEEDALLWERLARRLSPSFPTHLGSLLFCHDLSWRSVCSLHCAWAKPWAPVGQRKTLLQPEVFDELPEISSHLPCIPHGCRRFFVCVADTTFPSPATKVMQRHAADITQLCDAFISFTNRGSLAILSTNGKVMLQCKKLFCGLDKGRCQVTKTGMHVRKVQGLQAAAILGNNVAVQGVCGGSQHAGKDVFIVHSIGANLRSDLWGLTEEPRLLVSLENLLIYSPMGKQRHSASTIVKCNQSGIHERELWCIDIGLVPQEMKLNPHFAAIVASKMESAKLFLVSIHTGEIASSIDICFYSTLLLTDTLVAVSRDDGIVSIYVLPSLQELYALPFPDIPEFESGNFMSASMSLSPCGRFLGISGYLGELVLYDMIAHCIKYYGSLGLTSVERTREVGDGVWLWYRDVEWSPGQSEGATHNQVGEKIFYWQVRKPVRKSYKALVRSA